ncbi:MAG: hypothetical protein JO255_00940 [Alphaproteobacteria bacterium]|nr:hypothetical protein [Alphaproteobacteria bacterium]
MRRGAALIAAGAALLLAAPSFAAPPKGEDPDWPCQQRMVPVLGAATYWSGPPIEEDGDWTAEPRIAALVQEIAPRQVPAEQGEAAITTFADSLGTGDDKKKLLTLVFSGLLAETNRQRAEIIARLKELGHRQHELADIASHAGEELQTIPPDATGEAAARRADLEQRFTFVTQAFTSTQRTMRYACDIPVQLDARLGRYARALQARL